MTKAPPAPSPLDAVIQAGCISPTCGWPESSRCTGLVGPGCISPGCIKATLRTALAETPDVIEAMKLGIVLAYAKDGTADDIVRGALAALRAHYLGEE